MSDSHKNFAVSTVATAPSPASSGTTLIVAGGEGTKFPAVPFNATVWPAASQPTTSNAEIVRVTNRSTDTLTITRAQESSSARSITSGDQIAATFTVKTLTDIEDRLNTVATSGSAQTVDWATANTWDITLTAACTVTLSSVTSGVPISLTLILRQDGTGSRTVTWPGSVSWLGGSAPLLQTAASTVDIVTLVTVDGGTNWLGFPGSETALPWNAHILAYTDKSNSTTQGTWATTNWGDAVQVNGGYGLQNTSNAQNDEIGWKLPLSAGTWTFSLHVRKSTVNPIVTLLLDGTSIGTLDTYAASSAFATLSLTGVSVATGGIHDLHLKAATRNASSTGWQLQLLAVTATRTA